MRKIHEMATDDLETKNQKQDEERFYKSGNCAPAGSCDDHINGNFILWISFSGDNPSEQQPSRDLLPLWPRPTSLHLSNCPLTISKGKVVLDKSFHCQKERNREKNLGFF